MTIPLAQSAGLRWLTLGSALVIVCGLMLPVAVIDLRNAASPQNWRTTPGVVETSGVRTTSTSSGRLGVGVAYAPDVRFTYQVAGRTYQGADVYIGQGPDSEAAARATAARYAQGARVTVHYDPANPARAVLEPGIQSKNYHALMAMAAGLLAGFGCVLRFRAIRRREVGADVAPPRLSRRERRRLGR